MRRRSVVPPLLLAPLLLAGCERSPAAVPPPDEGEFSASITGAVAAAFEGQGFFHLLERPAPPGLPTGVPRSVFAVTASRVDPAAQRGQAFDLRFVAGGIPAVGRYPIASPLGPVGPEPTAAFFANYVHADRESTRVFAGHAGEVEITRSSDDRVEGRFRFTGAELCAAHSLDNPCFVVLHPGAPLPDPAALPSVDVVGTFVATRGPPVPSLGR